MQDRILSHPKRKIVFRSHPRPPCLVLQFGDTTIDKVKLHNLNRKPLMSLGINEIRSTYVETVDCHITTGIVAQDTAGAEYVPTLQRKIESDDRLFSGLQFDTGEYWCQLRFLILN
jgi:hypothetical protein